MTKKKKIPHYRSINMKAFWISAIGTFVVAFFAILFILIWIGSR